MTEVVSVTRMSLRRKTVTLPPDPRISLLEEEIRKARQYREYDVPYRSLDERLDTMESRVDVAGDMKKSQYDKNNNGKVDYAEIADWTYGIDWSNVRNKPSIPAPYSLPIATESRLGGVKSGGDIEVQTDGTVRVLHGGERSTIEASTVNGNVKVDGNELAVYRHPNTESIRHVTDSQIQYWNAKPGTAIATTTSDGLMSETDKTKLDGLSNYVHPTGDGNLHVPATGITNNGKVLKAGATAGSVQWGTIDWFEITNKPTTSTTTQNGICAFVSGELSVKNNVFTFLAPKQLAIKAIRVSLGTAPAGATVNLVIKKTGASITTLSVNSTSIYQTLSTVVNVNQGDAITLDITQVGSTTKGSDLSITIECEGV